MKIIILSTLILFSFSLNAQSEKKIISHEAYDIWKSTKNQKWTPDGELISYEIAPAKGDGYLFFQNSNTFKKDSIFKGTNALLHYKNEFAVFKITLGYDTIRQLKLNKVKKDKFPKDTMGIIWFKTDSILLISNIKSYKLSQEGDWLAYLSTEDERANCPTYKKWQILKKRRKCEKEKTSGFTLHVLNPLTSKKISFHQVKEYYFNKKGTKLIFTTSYKGKADSLSLQQYNLINSKQTKLLFNQLSIKNINFDKKGNQLVFMTTTDTNKIKTYNLAYWKTGDSSTTILVDTNSTGLNKGWAVSVYKKPFFSHSGKTVYFGTNTIVEQKAKDTLLITEKAKLDIWSWTDKKLQPQQLNQLKADKNKNFLTAFHINSKKIMHLENDAYDKVSVNTRVETNHVLLRNNKTLQLSNSWEFPFKSNYYVVNTKTGEQTLLIENQAYYPSLSPSGNYLIWFNGKDSTWNSTSVKSNKTISLTHQLNDIFYSDNNGSPYNPFPNGTRGWTNKNGNEKIIIKSEYDLWLIDPKNITVPQCLTKGLGKKNSIDYSISSFDRDSAYIKLDRTFIFAVNEKTREEFITTIKGIESVKYLKGDYNIYTVRKAKTSNKVLYRKMNITDYPEIFLTDINFESSTQLTHTNPQQKNYNWATVEQVNWKSFKGLNLKGLLYKPEDFDKSKSYPMIVYFYEKSDDRIHTYYRPQPTASVIHPTEYASNGYIVFIPNILYTIGHPAKSAYDCIVSGTDYLTSRYKWIDTTKLALQGQSWGGYQTAQLITMTNKYACGMAGAPVSNMFSAYGGVRWKSGMSRAFQYEHSQSRIGCTIWECPELYIENSPIFGLPKVNTPLLIMHNDNDGAVPWYQGIEMYMGLRRLEKPVWMLNYNGDSHNLMKQANRKDLSLRMKQFFDFYLKDTPIPLWMKNGVPATEKGNPSNLKLDDK